MAGRAIGLTTGAWEEVGVRKGATRKVRRKTKRGASIADLIAKRGGVAKFARELSQLSGEQVTWGRVNNWKDRNSVSKSMVLYVHQLTGAPLKDLLR